MNTRIAIKIKKKLFGPFPKKPQYYKHRTLREALYFGRSSPSSKATLSQEKKP